MKKLFFSLVCMAIFGLSYAQPTATHWTQPDNMNYNMIVTSIIKIDGTVQANENLEIGAFIGDECRGCSLPLDIDGEYWYFLMVASNSSNEGPLGFRLYDHAEQEELDYECLTELYFTSDAVYGDIDPETGDFVPFEFEFVSPVTGFHFITEGNWSEAANWLGGALPDAEDEAFIDAPCQLDMDAEVSTLTITENNSLTIQAGKTLIVTGELVDNAVTELVLEDGAQLLNSSANVNATVLKDIIAYGESNPDGWYTIASPVNEMPIDGSDFLTTNYDLYRFNETNLTHEEWENYKADFADFTSFENGRGYLYANSNTFSPAFTGTLNVDDVTFPLTYTDRTYDDLDGFNLIGNPYPHVIYKGSGAAIDDANLASGFYTLSNEGAWHVHTFEDAILPGQGILVKTSVATNLNITKSNVEASAEAVQAKAVAERLDITVVGNQGEDHAFVYFGRGINLNKIGGFSTNHPVLSIKQNGKEYAIAHIDDDTETVDLNFTQGNVGTCTMTVKSTAEFDYLHLIDNYNNMDVDLLQNPDYTFHSYTQEMEDRFTIVFRTTTGVEESQLANFCRVIGNMVVVEYDKDCVLTVTDVLGHVLKSVEMKDNRYEITGLQSGVYLVRLIDKDGSHLQKVVIDK